MRQSLGQHTREFFCLFFNEGNPEMACIVLSVSNLNERILAENRFLREYCRDDPSTRCRMGLDVSFSV